MSKKDGSNHTHDHPRGEEFQDAPKGYKRGFSNLIWNLREYGYPISKRSVELVREYLESNDLTADEAHYKVVAQSIMQNNEDIDFNTNNFGGTKQLRFSDY